MGYVKRIVCLANSLKEGGLCIAGREVMPDSFGGWVRPVSARSRAELTYLEYRYSDGSSPALLDMIDVPLLKAFPNGHQSENHLVDASKGWTKAGRCSFRRLSQLAEQPATLWSNSDHTSSGVWNCVNREQAKAENRSLHLVDGTGLTVWVTRGTIARKSFYGEFQMASHRYKLCITDPAVRDHFESYNFGNYRFPLSGKIYLCVSLTEPWSGDGRCHKLIAAVIADRPLASS